ncbi:MAG: hypothetical protein AB1324_01765 [Candidatus Micrarchaeota archaeon]
MRLFFVVIAVFLLLGCTGGEQPPPQNVTNETNETPKPPPIDIIIGNQTNQTQIQNQTEEPEPEPEPIKKELDYTYEPEQIFGIFFFDVGGPGLHGDAILIKKGDMDILVDAGSAEMSERTIDYLRSRSVDDIEVLVSTNADPRHYGGIAAVAERYKIEELWWSGESFGDNAYAALMENVSGSVKTARVVERGYSADLNGMNFTVLNPQNTQRFEDVNNDAIVMRVVDRNFSLLLTSGIQTGAQGRLVNEETSLIQTDVMQAPYYGVGAGTSNIGIFLITAKPDAVIVSGSSDESAPNGGSREPFERLLKQYEIEEYKNYVNGTLRITSNGDNYTIMELGSGQ